MILDTIKNIFRARKRAKALVKASIMLQKAIDEADRKYQKTGHRYYVVYDPDKKDLAAITYDLYMLKTDSYIYLRRRGRFATPLKREELKQRCFYYTPSKNVPHRACPKEIRQKKMLLWQKFYELKIHGKAVR